MGIPKPDFISIEEYLEIEAQSDFKYEYHDGDIYAMAGGSNNHGFIVGNIYRNLQNSFKSKNSTCKAINSEIKIHIKSLNVFMYPDTSVVCGKIEAPEKGEGICNPIVVVEVLSKGTEGYDRGDKFYKYRQIPSLEEYVLISQEEKIVEVYSKQPNTELWKITRYSGDEAILKLDSINENVKIKDLYIDTSIE